MPTPTRSRAVLLCLCLLALLLLSVPRVLPAQERAEEPEAEGTPAESSAPGPRAELQREAEVTGTVVNVRSGPGIAYGVVTKVMRGSRVTVVGERDGWLKVVMPENEYSWVAGQFVEKGTGDTATVLGDGVNVRAAPSIDADVLGQLSRSVQVLIVEEKQGWIRIKPAPGAVGYISADFVKELSGEASAAATITAEEAVRRFAEAEALYKAEVAKPDFADWDLKKLAALYQPLALGSADRDVRFMAENRLTQIATYQSVQDSLAARKAALADLEDKIAELEAEYARKMEELRKATDEPRYLATGVLKKLAISFLPPATHKIEGEDRILFLLHSTDVALDAYLGKPVGLQGTMTVPKGWETPLVRVTSVRVLSP